MAWKEMRLPIAESVAEVRNAMLDRLQQAYLAWAWPEVWLEPEWTEDAWRRALGFKAGAWELQRDDYAAVLDRGNGVWALKFMVRERQRQEGESAAQGVRARKRWKPDDAVASGGMPAHAVASERMPVDATASPASASASEPRTLSRSRNGREKEISYTAEFEIFWENYRCVRRTGKPQAFREWVAAGGQRISEQVMAALVAYQKTAQWRDGFMPEPARWLKKRPWEDGPVPAEEGSW